MEMSESCLLSIKKRLILPFLCLPKSPLSYLIFIMSTFHDIHSEVSEGEFSDTLNTSAFVQMALDTLSIPTMSTEYERAFSSTKKLVTPHRCSIKEDLIKVTE
jgi:hypothetical protein